jgi:fatty acid desaturase
MSQQSPEPEEGYATDPDWFRAPTRREHWIGAVLFVTFGIFFALLFIVLSGWWFRWVILGLGAVSVLHGLRHARGAMGVRKG